MCKRLIDAGRLQFLRDLGFQTEMVHYCPERVSPENALLLAWREEKPPAEPDPTREDARIPPTDK